ncbi:MAG: SDR family NAD(P)-dependent oxidoreductase [Acidobacteria bacterium]|nr:SDR family NAD(P)-dependent oxidoreductase [Acidobacteriota bacterium]
MRIENRVALISGGASGLGAACAAMIAEDGGYVAIADLDQARGAALAAQLSNDSLFVCTDVARADSAEAAVAAVLARFGRIDIAINCAGVCPGQRVIGKDGSPMSLDAFARVIQINLIGTFNMTRLAAAAMAKNEPMGDSAERGVIVNTASVAAYEGQIGQTAYAASKAGIAGLTLPLARDLARHGIRAMAVAPGIFDTPLLAGLPEDVRASLAAGVPFPQALGQPSQFAALVRHIVENSYLNGEVIRLDAALRMAPK